jgi:hypothetical protein
MLISPRLYVYVHKAYTETIFFTQTHLIFDELRANGATVLVGDDFKAADPRAGDKLLIYGNVDFAKDVVERFAPEHRWNYVVDEGGAGQSAYDRSLSYMQKLDIRNMVVTYQNAAHLAKIAVTGRHYVVMPQCVPTVRPKVAKMGDIFISGQMSDTVYPTRTRLNRLLSRALPNHVYSLSYPGCDNPNPVTTIYAEKYYQLLDGYKLALTCRAGDRDRFVAKYVEFGASHVLPIGDCPTYMPKAMKDAMINVEGMSDGEVVSEVARLLGAPGELQERTDAFTAEVEARYIASTNMERVVGEIMSR